MDRAFQIWEPHKEEEAINTGMCLRDAETSKRPLQFENRENKAAKMEETTKQI